ncbi:MAG: oligosaccharide flippase family protein [Planctomycetes bacterium]|nr:oligosaccharide flippase family protein [Planctomycetota bacterium]
MSPAESLSAAAIRGSIWTVAGYGAGQALRFISNLILARLLFPEAFGLMALVNTMMQGLAMFSDVGIGPSIIQNPRGDDERFLNTAWTIQVLRGAAIWIIALALAQSMAGFYREPGLQPLVAIAAFGPLAAGFNSTAVFTASRRLRLGRLTLVDLGAQAVGMMVTIAWAWREPTVWALAGGGLAGTGTRMALTHVAFPGKRNRPAWDPSAVRALSHFGKWIFLSTLTTFLAAQLDRLIFGRMMSLEQLGVYSIALLLAQFPTQIVTKIGMSVVFPTYSRVIQDGRPLDRAYFRARAPMLVLGAGAILWLVSCGPSLVSLLYDQRYAGAGVMLQLLAIGAWFQMLECTNGNALLALGEPSWVAAGNIAKVVSVVVLVPSGYAVAGLHGAIVGLVVADVVKYVVSTAATRAHGLSSGMRDAVLTLILLGLGAAGAALCAALDSGNADGTVGLVVLSLLIAGAFGGFLVRSRELRRLRAW